MANTKRARNTISLANGLACFVFFDVFFLEEAVRFVFDFDAGRPRFFVFFVVFFVAIKSSPDTTNMYDTCQLIRSVLKLYYTLNRFFPQVFYRTDVYILLLGFKIKFTTINYNFYIFLLVNLLFRCNLWFNNNRCLTT